MEHPNEWGGHKACRNRFEFVSRIMDRLVILRVGLGLLLLVSIASLLPYSIAAQNSRDDQHAGRKRPALAALCCGQREIRSQCAPRAGRRLSAAYINIDAKACPWKWWPNMANGGKCATMRAAKAGCMRGCCAPRRHVIIAPSRQCPCLLRNAPRMPVPVWSRLVQSGAMARFERMRR